MLAAISQVLNECTKPDQASPAAIVLQGLQALCEAEVRLNCLVTVFHVLLANVFFSPSRLYFLSAFNSNRFFLLVNRISFFQH